MAASPLITLTTDFGLTDTYVGVIKGVIASIAPEARIIDLTHAIAPQNILEASLRLEAACPYFPTGTLHLVVVDPGVGSSRSALAIETETNLFVAPDNGVLTLPLRQSIVKRIVQLGPSAETYFRHPISATFHGRDVFAPIAAHLVLGLPLEALGDTNEHFLPIELALPEPQTNIGMDGAPFVQAHVLYSDHFGNLITDVTAAFWQSWLRESGYGAEETALAARVQVETPAKTWPGIAPTFSAVPVGSPVAYWGSAGRLELAVRNGNAAQDWNLFPGASFVLRLLPERILS